MPKPMHPARLPLAFFSLSCILFLASASAAGDDLAARIDSVVRGPDYKHSRWGLLAVDAETGKVVYEHNADQLFAPASVTKLFTCGAALVGLGADYKFETPVYARGEWTDGRLKGNLILVAKGDLCLGGRTDAHGKLAFKDHDHIYAGWLSTKVGLTDTDPLAGLADLARQVKAAGIRHIDGDVLIDTRFFVPARGSGSGPVLLSPIVVNDNLIDVILTPADKPGRPASVAFRPQTSRVQVDAQVETVPADQKTKVGVEHVGPQRYVLRGQVPAGSPPVVRICPIDDPAGFARALFIETLRREGVSVFASTLRPPTEELPEKDSYARLPRVALYTSPPLSEYLKVTLKVSHNLYASILPLLLAVQDGKRTLVEGMEREGKILADLGVDVGSISLESGAGGGNGDRVTPRATVQLLQGLARRSDFGVFKAGLPVLGVDGTLVDAVPAGSPARGKVWAKTGTYGDPDLLNDRMLLRSKALAGAMTTKAGRSLFFAFFVNEVPQPRNATQPREAKVLAHLCEIFYEHTP
jgi:D-alanyl-D-alanine carboxypeptidase/D-alanyl-D-alanine-endopeptidase (penicillin-binding protein 4)